MLETSVIDAPEMLEIVRICNEWGSSIYCDNEADADCCYTAFKSAVAKLVISDRVSLEHVGETRFSLAHGTMERQRLPLDRSRSVHGTRFVKVHREADWHVDD